MEVIETSTASDGVLREPELRLELAGVSKRYGNIVAVSDIFFAARSGEVHALLGENGAGKSTLMGIASGVVRPDSGTVSIGGQAAERLTAAHAQEMGLAIVHQHPAVLPELTVAENMLLAIPAKLRKGEMGSIDWVRQQLQRVGCNVHPQTRMSEVDLAQRQLYELAKALAIEPRVLILDEPTATLTADLVELLFEKIRASAARGAAIVYISHRLQEIRQIADRVTVMRDGEVKGTASVENISDDEILHLIVGRTLSQTFPQKDRISRDIKPSLVVEKLSGENFYDVSMMAHPGEIVGIAGIVGNGQSEFLRALGGLGPARGVARLRDKVLDLGRPDAARQAGICYLSGDRQKEGLFMSLSVRENAAVSALPLFSRLGFVRRSKEYEKVGKVRSDLAIKTASVDTTISALSGGNQQKVVLARALLAQASLVLAEEPTAGVDVGARAEIYRILRDVASRGTPVVIVSSDILELEGLCDRVLVISRGHVAGELSGHDVSEAGIGRIMMTATSQRLATDRSGARSVGSRLRTFTAGDYVPSLVLAGLILLLGVFASSQNMRFVSGFNIEKTLFLSAALAFVSFGQMCTVFTGRIDLSVGPLIGLSLVIASFFLNEGAGMGTIFVGLLAIFGAAALTGLTNGVLVRFGNFTAVAATLGVYIVIQGISVLLRPYPDGPISAAVMDTIKAAAGNIPIVFIIAVVLAIILEVGLRYSRWGMSLRAVGSNEKAAAHIGVRTGWTVVGAFIACSLLTALGGMIVVAQLGIGDPNQGIEYTLGSIAAVVLGGASLFGGRGSFIGVLLGAILIQEVNSSMVFLGLSQAWQYWFIGLLTLIAVAIYSQAQSASFERS